MQYKISCFLAAILFVSGAHSERQAPSEATLQSLSTSDRRTYEKLFRDSLLFFNKALRNADSGQYYDAIPLNKTASLDYNSSVAASGMGLISLALADATGTISGAREKALQTLLFLQGKGAIHGVPYASKRSRAGWYRHWFDARTGEDNKASLADGYSTVDTAILVAGAQMAAHYFASTGQDQDGKIRLLADQILFSVRWDSAIADLNAGKLYLNYDLKSEAPKSTTSVFNEYLLVACMGKYAEQKKQEPGKMTQFWNQHYGLPDSLPRKDYEGLSLMTDHPGHFLSNFVVQFTHYLCSDVSQSQAYLTNMSNARQADQKWFSQHSKKNHLWGLGAGEVRYRSANSRDVSSSYHADSLNENPHVIVSPHIIAGFIPVYPQGLQDLLTMYKNHECVYKSGDFELLWRCSLTDPDLAIDRLQAIDYSSMFLGLSSIKPGVGMDFFRRYAPGSQNIKNRN